MRVACAATARLADSLGEVMRRKAVVENGCSQRPLGRHRPSFPSYSFQLRKAAACISSLAISSLEVERGIVARVSDRGGDGRSVSRVFLKASVCSVDTSA